MHPIKSLFRTTLVLHGSRRLGDNNRSLQALHERIDLRKEFDSQLDKPKQEVVTLKIQQKQLTGSLKGHLETSSKNGPKARRNADSQKNLNHSPSRNLGVTHSLVIEPLLFPQIQLLHAGDINFQQKLPGDEGNKSSQLMDAGRDLNPTCEKHSTHRTLRHLTSTEPDLHRIDPNDFMVKKKA